MVVYFFVFFGTMTSWGYKDNYSLSHHLKYVIKYGEPPKQPSRMGKKLTAIDDSAA